jgi:hypothetical protein
MVVPPALIAATLEGATNASRLLELFLNSLKKVVFPVPAPPDNKIFLFVKFTDRLAIANMSLFFSILFSFTLF